VLKHCAPLKSRCLLRVRGRPVERALGDQLESPAPWGHSLAWLRRRKNPKQEYTRESLHLFEKCSNPVKRDTHPQIPQPRQSAPRKIRSEEESPRAVARPKEMAQSHAVQSMKR